MKNLFQDYMYGRLPPKPRKMTVTRGPVVTDDENRVTLQELEVKLEQGDRTLPLHVRLTLPMDATGRVPVIAQAGFGRRGPGRPGTAAVPTQSSPPGRPFSIFTKRGYAVAELDFQEVAIDNKDRARIAGVYQLFGDKIDCGGLMAWAWGVHRVIDALERIDKIDSKKIIVTGHSRYGKAALIAGAFDERIALTIPSHSGCGGGLGIGSSTARVSSSRISWGLRPTGSGRISTS